MLRKVLKSIAGISVMLLLAGIFCMIPSFSKELLNQKSQAQTIVDNSLSVDNDNLTNADSVEISGNANANSLNISSITGSWQNAIQNADTSVSLSKVTYNNKKVNGYTFYGLENVYEISSAEQLALLAYYVNSGNATYNSTTAVYILTANIDLGSKLWTPIGTATNPFKASFIGVGYKISNVRVNDLTVVSGTNNGAGLFGNVSGNISDLVLGGTYSIDTTTEAHKYKGYLVGNLTGQVINCYTYGLSVSNLNAVGNGGTVYGGTTLDGKTALKLDEKTETSYKAITGSGKMHSYYISETNSKDEEYNSVPSFYIANNNGQQNWYNGNVYRMINGTTNNPIYTNAVPVLRESASEGKVYPLYVGNKAKKLPTDEPTSSGVTQITFDSVTITHTFNYGYGTRTITLTDIKYDQSFVEFFTERPQYRQRLGYNFSTLNNSDQENLNKEIFNVGYPVANGTSTFTWTAQKGRNINLQLVTGVNSDGGSDTEDFTNLPGGLIISNISGLNNASLADGYSDGFNSNFYVELQNITSGSVSFNITILAGYSLQINKKDSSVAFDGSSITATGKHDEENGYQTSGRQQDSYNLITGSHSFDTLDNGNKVYTITIDNIVGEGGTLNIRVVRDSIETQLKINLQSINGNLPKTPPQLKAYYTITGLDTDKDGSDDQIELCADGNHSGNYVKGVFTIDFSYKMDQNITITVELTNSNDGFYILRANETLKEKVNIKPTPGNASTEDSFFDKYAKNINFNTTIDYPSSSYQNVTEGDNKKINNYFEIVVGLAQTAVQFEYYVGESKITSEGGDYSDIQTSINSSNNNGELSGGTGVPGNSSTSLVFVGLSSTVDNFYVRTNGKYDLDRIVIGNQTINKDESKEPDYGKYTYILSNGLILTEAYSNTKEANYIVKIYLKEREHSFNDAKVTFRADGSDLYRELGLSSANFSDLFELSISNTKNSSYNGFDYKNNDNISLTITLTEMARKIFYINTNKFITIDESAYAVYTGGGYQSANANEINVQDNGEGEYIITFIAGTFDFNFIFNLTYKTITGSVVGAKDIDGNDVVDNGIALNKYNFELKYNYNTEKNTYSLTAERDFKNISIFQKYYLLGWYLVNGEVILTDNPNVSAIIGEEGDALDSYYTSVKGRKVVYGNTLKNEASFTFNLYAVIGERTIQVEYDEGDILNGEIKETGVTDNPQKEYSFIYEEKYSILDQEFLNLGNSVRGYTLTLLDAHDKELADFSLPDSQKTEISLDTDLNYSGLDWWKIWVDGDGNYSNGLQAWSGLFNNREDNTDKDNDSIRIIKVTYLWKPIRYELQIDGQETYITIGSEITAEDDGSRTGTAKYQILVKDLPDVTLKLKGGDKPGYTAVSFNIFNIYQQSQDPDLNWKFGSEEEYTLSIARFKKLINEEYWYKNSESCIINISTQRVGAHFKVYIEQSEENYYQLAWNVTDYPLNNVTKDEEGNILTGTNEYGGIDEKGIFIYVTYGSAITEADIKWTLGAPKYSLANVLPENLDKFINFTRSGYKVNLNYYSFNIDGGQNNYYTIKSANSNFVKIEAGAQYSDTDDQTVSTADQTVSIRWTYVETTVVAKVEKNEDVRDVLILALLNSKELTQNATITDAKGNTYTDSEIIGKTIENGDSVIAYGFNVYILQEDGSYEKEDLNSSSIYQFNLNLFKKAGKYQVKFYVTLNDYYGTKSYPVESNALEFTVQRNYFVFTKCEYDEKGDIVIVYDDEGNEIVGNHIVSAYSGTNKFHATTAGEGYDDLNKFGQVYFALNWDSSKVTKESAVKFDFEEFFLSSNTDLSISGDYSVGDARDLKVTINSNTFNSVNSINGYAVSANTNWEDLVVDVDAEGSDYIHVAKGLVNIVKARFTINFGESSSFYFNDVETVVYMSDNSFTFNVGNVNFSYKLDRIIYTGGECDGNREFTNPLLEQGFEVKGLSIQKGSSDESLENFEYSLEGIFTLYDSNSAIKKNYQTAYITSDSTGTLLNTLQTIYDDQIENLILESVSVDGSTIATSDLLEGEFGTYSVGNDVLFSFVGNHTPNLTIYFNQDIISANKVSYTVRVYIATSRSSNLSMLAFHDSDNVNDYLGYFDTTYQKNSFDLNQEVSGGDTALHTTYAVLSDVRKVTVKYNGGYNGLNGDGNQITEQIFYVSYNGGTFSLPTPAFNYSGMSFNGYSYAGEGNENADPKYSGSIQEGFKLNVTKGGEGVTITAKWKLNEVSGEQIEDTFNFSTDLKPGKLALTDILTLQALPQGIFTYTFEKVPDPTSTDDESESITFDPIGEINNNFSDIVFSIEDSSGWLSSKLDGQYTLTVTIEYSDRTGGNYSVSRSFDITLKVTKKAVGIEKTSGDLTFNNANQIEAVTVNILGNEIISEGQTGSDSEKKYDITAVVSLSDLLNNKDTTAKTYGIDVVLGYRETDEDQYSVSQEMVIRNAGQYQVTISINSNYTDIYNLNKNKSMIYIVVNKYTLDINLSEYANQVTLWKYFGEDEPELKKDITVATPTLKKDTVNITFVRKDGEAIGVYPYTDAKITNDGDQRDYNLIFNPETFTSKFEIKAPEDATLYVEMTNTLNYIYNGQKLGNIDTIYEDRNFKVVGMAGTLRVEQTFKLYYLATGQKIDIPEVERVTYAGYINFSSDTDLTQNAGSYTLNVALSSSDQADNWNGVVFSDESQTNQYNKIVVKQREIHVDGGSMVFNQKSEFTYNTSATNYASLNIQGYNETNQSGIVAGDTIIFTGQLSSSEVGQYFYYSPDNTGENRIRLTIDNANYKISISEGFVFSITPSDAEISLNATTTKFEYGTFRKNETGANDLSDLLENIKNKLVLSLNIITSEAGDAGEGAESEDASTLVAVAEEYYTIESVSVTDAQFSSGRYLKSGTYAFMFTVSSSNFNFGNDASSANEGLYTKIFEISVTIEKIEITISNRPGTIITKVYDHNVNVIDKFVNQNVNQEQGYYISSRETLTGIITGILAGDTISVVSAEYEDKKIGSNKKINVVYGNDYENYKIDDSGLVGDITEVKITFQTNLNTTTFVDGIILTNGDFDVTYTGDMSDFIEALISKYVQKSGYKQIAWKYNGVTITALQEDVPTDVTSFDTFIGQAVAGNSTGGITLNAEWQIQSYTVTFEFDSDKVGINENLTNNGLPVDYWTSFTGDDKITFSIDSGYVLKSVSIAYKEDIEPGEGENEILNTVGIGKRDTNSFEIVNIISDVTITIEIREIKVLITIDTNEPKINENEYFASEFVDNSDNDWTDANNQWASKELVLPYSVLSNKDLPVVQITQENTYDFLKWTLGDKDSSGDNIWERISGDDFVKDNIETGFTFIANWTEASLTITINGTEQTKSIEVTKIDGEIETEIKIQDGVYNIHYNDQIRIDIVAKDWWKVSSYREGTGEAQTETIANGRTSYTIEEFTALKNLVYNLNIQPINITFTPTYQTPKGSSVTNAVSISSKTYTFTSLQGLTIQDIGTYTLTAGTYTHDYWLYTFEGSQKTLDFTKYIEEFIVKNGGTPTQDRQYTLTAHFQGVEYTITWDATDDQTGGGTINGQETCETTQIYGDLITFPTVTLPVGRHLAYWTIDKDDEDSDTFETGEIFTLTTPKSDLTITLYAVYNDNIYTVTINYDTAHVNKVTINEIDYTTEATNGQIVLEDDSGVVHGQTRVLEFDFATGYTFDDYSFSLGEGNANVILDKETSTATLANVLSDITITITVTVKEYTVTIDRSTHEQNYESITQGEEEIYNFTIFYLDDIADILNGITFSRYNYTPDEIIVADSDGVFATYSDESWTAVEGIYSNEYGQYINDSDLEIKVVWAKNGSNYISGTVTPVEGLVYNGLEQTVATSTWKSENPEDIDKTLQLNTILANGDQIIRLYYTVDGLSGVYENNLNLKLKNTINAKATLTAVIQDTLNPTFTYTVTVSTSANVVISKSDIVITGANVVSYYTGSSQIAQTDDYSQGTFTYTGGEDITELQFLRVEIVDESELYNVGADYQVRYLFTGRGINISNYNGLRQQNAYYVYEPSDVKATIVHSPFTVTVSGMGFEIGTAHAVNIGEITFPDYLNNGFRVSTISISTNGYEAKEYTGTENFDASYTVLNNNDDEVSDNFQIEITGSFEILDDENGYKISTVAKYLDLTDKENPSLSDIEGYTISITDAYVGTSYEDLSSKDTYNWIIGNTLMLTIYNNNTENPIIIFNKTQNPLFEFVISDGMSVLCWTDDEYSASDAKTYLDALTEESARTYQESFNSAKNVVVLLTDFKAIHFSLGDKGGEQDTKYMKAGETATYNLLPANKWTGFVANGWMSANSQVITSGFDVAVSDNADITAVTLTMEWSLADINISESIQSITRDAKTDLDADIDKIAYSEIITGIDNNNSAITYTYVFSRNGQNLTSNNAPLLVPANTQSAGQYTLTVTAGYSNYVTKSASVNFTLNITKLKLDIAGVTLSETSLNYANYDYTQSITATLGDYGEFSLDKLINASETQSIYFTLGVDKIINAGTYNLVLHVNEYIFNSIESEPLENRTFNITINKATVTITNTYLESINIASKPFSTIDPSFTFNYRVAFESTSKTESIVIRLERDPGETCGEYSFTSAICTSSSNFVIEMEAGLAFTIDPSEATLLVSFDNLKREYNSENATLTITFDEENSVWTISSDNDGNRSNISLSIRAEDGTSSALNPELYRIALNGITIGVKDAENAGDYTGFAVRVADDANFKQENIEVSGSLTITPKGLVIASVTKTFDRNATFSSTVTQFANLETGDNITLSGNFAQVTVGTNIALSDLALSGDDAGNYTIANADTIRGSIVALNVTQASMTLNQNTFTYGTLNKDLTITQLLSLSSNATVVVTSGENDDLQSGENNDFQNGYLSIESWQVDPANLSTGGYLKVGEISLTFTISSKNFSFNGNPTTQVTANVTISQKELDLSKLVIAKNYDGDKNLPSSLSTSVAGFGLMRGDDVSIDRENSCYQSSLSGSNIPVDIILEGTDATNYIAENATGTIFEYSIFFNVNVTDQVTGDFVTDGRFVNDGESIVVDNPYFSFEMSYIETIPDGNPIMNSLIYPTRTGYSVTGWKYQADDGTFYDLSASNVRELIYQVDQDESNEEKIIYIYPVWSINYYSVTVNGKNIDSSTITSKFTQGNKIKYFTDFTIDLVADLGFKIKSYNITNGSVESYDFSDVDKRNSHVAITGLGSDLILEALTAEIQVTIEIDTNLRELLNTERTDSKDTKLTYSYSKLKSIFLKDLPALTVTEGTYTLSGYTYGDDVAIGDQSLQNIVLSLDKKLNADTSITLTAQWSGVNYKITLDANGGEFADGTSTAQIDVVYGEKLPAIPTATKTGQTPVWTAPYDETYESGKTFASIGTKASDEDYYTLTLTAIWQNASFTLTVNIDPESADRVSLLLGGANVASGSQFTLVYDETSLTFTLSLAQGYGYQIDDSDFHGKFDGMSTSDKWAKSTFTISNLFADSTITLQAIPAQNSLTLSAENVASVSVQIDKGEASVFDNLTSAFKQSFTVYTESKVTITLTAKKGYLFTTDNITLEGYAGVGEIESTIAPDQKSATIVWRDFTTSANIAANATAGLNAITIPDLTDILVSLTINGGSVALTGGKVQVYTDSVVTINAIFRYGYEGIVDEFGKSISLSVQNQSNIAIIDAQTVEFNTSSRNYVLSATLGGLEEGKINEAFSINVQGKARVYNFALSVNPGQEDIGSVVADLKQTVTFGSTLQLESSPTNPASHILEGWVIRDGEREIVISYQDTDLEINESLREALETIAPGDTINVYALFTNLSTSVTFASGAYGGYKVTQDQISASINGGATPTEVGLEYAKDIVLNVSAGLGDNGGYEIDQIIVDGITYSVNLLDSNAVFSVQGEQEESQTIRYDTQTVLSIGGRNLTLTISLLDASNKANVTITIPFDVYNRFSSLTINYKASSILVKVTAGVLLDGILANYGTGDGGKIYLADKQGEKLGDEYYLDANGQILNGEDLENLKGVDYYIRSYTDATIYFVLEANSGFSESFGGNNGSSYNVTVKDQTLYGFTGISAGAEVFATFSAKSNKVVVNYIYQNENGTSTNVNAGGFNLTKNTSDSVVITSSSSGNSSNSIAMQALTGANFELRLNTNLVYNFASHGGILRYSIDGEYDEEYTGVISYINDMTLGFTYETTFGIRNVQSNLTINIFVEPKSFNLILNVVDGNTYTLENAITYGEMIDLSSITESDRVLVLTPTRDGYTFGGYFTQEVGFGNQYIDGTGNATNSWLETGYTFSNSQNAYIPNANFNPSSQTFTIYAYWIYNQAFITVEFQPNSMNSYVTDANIQDIVTNQTLLIDATNRWYAAVTAGTQLNFSALSIDGYKFINWTIYQDEQSLGTHDAQFSLTTIQASYRIVALYQPTYSISSTKGGSASFVQNGSVLTGGSYDQTQDLILQATAEAGYQFLRFVDLDTGEEYLGTYNADTGAYTYDFGIIDRPLNIQAVFEGRSVAITIDPTSALTVHRNLKIYLDGEEMADHSFTASIDQTVSIEIDKAPGFDIELIGAQFETQNLGYNRYRYNYILGMDHVTEQDGQLVLNIAMNVVRQEIDFEISFSVQDLVDQDELLLAGNMTFTMPNGQNVNLNYQDTVTMLYGESGTLNINILENYALSSILFNDSLLESDITENLTEGTLAINPSLYSLNYSETYYISIMIVRKLWTDEGVRSESLLGSGTKDDPYIIASASDFGLMAYLINSGAVNENDVSYAECHYKLTSNIDFEGNYWSPIGDSVEHAFKGSIDLGGYSITNLLLYRTYTKPSTSYGGLFWHIDGAKISQDNSTLIITLSIIGGILLLIAIIVLIILLVRKKKKKELEEIASGTN